jgi:hypothetical protein
VSNKSVKLYCYDCDLEFTVKFSVEDTFADPEHCPFCGEEISIDDGDSDEISDDEALDTGNWDE